LSSGSSLSRIWIVAGVVLIIAGQVLHRRSAR
jgi:hypothetical protein